MPQISIREVCEACRDGRIDDLQVWKAANRLPSLMKTADNWHPHDYAIYHDHLDILKWLVFDSGQRVDLAVHHNSALHLAGSCNLEVVKWLLLESEQPLDISDADNEFFYRSVSYRRYDTIRWVLFESAQLERVLSCNLEWLSTAPNALRADVDVFFDFLRRIKQLGGSPTAGQSLYRFPQCQEALAAGLVSSLTELEKLAACAKPRETACRL